METMNATKTDALAARSIELAQRAERLLRAGEYLPGRPHFAGILAERIYHLIVDRLMARHTDGVGRATLASLAWRLFTVANNPARAEGARMLGASIMGTRLDGGCLEVGARLDNRAERKVMA